jgi:AcrR family transcriptional regulator
MRASIDHVINKPQEPIRRRRSPAERALEIALAAESLALEDGLAALTLRGLGARVGVASSLIAHYEVSTESLVARTFRILAEREITEVTAIVDAQHSPTDRLRALVDAVADPARDDVAALWSDAWSLGRRNEALAEAARECMGAWQSLAERIVAGGVATGEFAGDAADAPHRVALLLFALVDATNAYALVDYRTAAERDQLIRRAVALAVAVPPERLTEPRG